MSDLVNRDSNQQPGVMQTRPLGVGFIRCRGNNIFSLPLSAWDMRSCIVSCKKTAKASCKRGACRFADIDRGRARIIAVEPCSVTNDRVLDACSIRSICSISRSRRGPITHVNRSFNDFVISYTVEAIYRSVLGGPIASVPPAEVTDCSFKRRFSSRS